MVDSTTIVAVRESRDRLNALKRHLEIYRDNQGRGSISRARYVEVLKEVEKAQRNMQWAVDLIDKFTGGPNVEIFPQNSSNSR